MTPTLEASSATVLDRETASSEFTPRRASHLPVGESITRGALALLSTQPVTWAGSLLTTIVAPRLLGADALGQFTVAITIATIAGIATNLGISEWLVRRIAQHPATLRQDLGVALEVQMVVAVLGALAIALAAPLGAFPVADQALLYFALLGMLILPVQTVLLSSFRGREMHGHYAWFNAAGMVLGQVAGVLALFAGAGVVVYTAIIGISMIVVTGIGWKLSGLRPIFPPVTRALFAQFREFIQGGFPFWTSTLTLTITTGIDRVLLGAFVPAAEVGWYAAAYRVFSIPVFVPTLIITPLFPALSRSVNQPDTIRRTITKTMRIVLLMMVPLSAGTIVVAPAIPALLGWPSDFTNASPLIAILSAQLPLVAVDMVLGVVLMAIGRQGPWVIVGIIAGVLKIGLDYAAIPLFENLAGNGGVGASIVTLVIEVVMFLGAVVLLPKHLLDPRIAWDAARILIAGMATYFIGAALLPLSLLLCVLGGALAYVVVGVALRVMTWDDARPVWYRLLARTQGRQA
jgi:O-antigen/teichoic acid export membrane protein